jgi:predicted nucleic acid-binding protein
MDTAFLVAVIDDSDKYHPAAVVMKDYALTTALTVDHHFEQAGYAITLMIN